jgi:hypothetical protein
MQASITQTSTGFLGGSLFSFLLIAGIAAYLGFSDTGSKPADEESNSANPEISKNEEARKAETNSPI